MRTVRAKVGIARCVRVTLVLPAGWTPGHLLSSLLLLTLALPLVRLTQPMLCCSCTPIALLLRRVMDGLPLSGAPFHRTLDVALVLVICDPRLVDDT